MHLHAVRTCCMFKLLSLSVCPCCMSLLHFHAVSQWCMSLLHVHALCPCCNSLLYVHAVCPRCMSLQHVLAPFPYYSTCPLFMFILHLHCPCYMFLRNGHDACPSCMSRMHVHASIWMNEWCMNMLHGHVAWTFIAIKCCYILFTKNSENLRRKKSRIVFILQSKKLVHRTRYLQI